MGHYLQGRKGQQTPSNTNADVGLGPTKPNSSANINRQVMQEEIPSHFHQETPPHRVSLQMIIMEVVEEGVMAVVVMEGEVHTRVALRVIHQGT